MTPLAHHIANRIRAEGPLRIADYMADCLLHPTLGYYARQDPFGTGGDFTTAPEISQMFGELVGLSLAQAWLDQGRPAPFCLAELGPGRGTLMADILRATRGIDGFHAAAHVVLMEASPTLRDVQRSTLAAESVDWISSVSELPEQPLFLAANEFFDALPIRQFERADAGWRERHIGLNAAGALSPGLSPMAKMPELSGRLGDTEDGDVVEICPPAPDIMQTIATRIASFGGAALVIDYGGWHSRGDTFQAVRAHQTTDPFAAPGDADLTAHVDFEPLALAARAAGARCDAPTPQGEFLERLGITARAQAIARGLSGDALRSHVAAHRRLTHPAEMGTLFLVLGVAPVASPPLAGLRA